MNAPTRAHPSASYLKTGRFVLNVLVGQRFMVCIRLYGHALLPHIFKMWPIFLASSMKTMQDMTQRCALQGAKVASSAKEAQAGADSPRTFREVILQEPIRHILLCTAPLVVPLVWQVSPYDRPFLCHPHT